MRTSWNQLTRFAMRGTLVALLSLLTIGLMATSAFAQTSNTVVNQTIPLAALSSNGTGTGTKGGWGGSSTPTGETFVVDSHGNAIVGTNWAESLLAVNTSTGAVTVLISGYNNVGPVALDTAGNLYVGNTYSSNIYKIPYTSTGYAAISGSALPTAVCAGAVNTTTDTAACQFALNLQDSTGYYGIAAMAIDPSGNFWIATNQWPGEATNGKPINNSLLMCNTTCQTGAQYADAPVTVYTDSTATDELGEFAFDPWGNLFYTQASFSGGLPTASGLYEISPNTSGGFYSPTPVVTYTNSATYSNSLGGVAIDPVSGTVYFTTNADGIFAIPNTESGGPNTTNTYTVSLVGGKGIALDSSDNLYQIAYGSAFFSSGSDMVERISVGDATTPPTGAGQTMDVPLTVIDNGGTCSGGTPSTLGFSFSGTDASQFKASVNAPTAPATTSCNTPAFGVASPVLPVTVSFPVTLAYTPSGTGTSTATMATTDAVTNATGSTTLTGVSEKPQAISFTTSLTWTYSSGLTIALAASGGKSGNPVVFTLVSGPATLDSTVANQLDVSAPGTIVVQANQAGSGTPPTGYAPAPTLTENIVVNPIAQAITFTPVPPRNVTTAASPITLTATGGASGNPVVFSLDASSTSGVATLSGTNDDTLTFSGTAGVVVIDANQTGNTDYAAAPQVQATIVVSASLLATGPPVVLSESTYLGELTGGGATSASDPNGGTMAIDPNGDAIIGSTYGSSVLSFNITNTNPGHQSEIAADTGNPSAVAVDANGNLFVGDTYGGAPYVYKIPWVSGAYATYTAKPTADCTGTDTTPCLMANVTAGATYPIQSLVFDKQGDLFYGVQVDSGGAGTTGITDQASIWECDTNCLYAGTDAPVMIFQEPAAGTTPLSGGTSVQLVLGSLAIDPSGNIFFTDAAIDTSSLIHYSDLNELVNSSGSYPTTATVLVTNIPSAPGEYVGEIDAVSIDPTAGTVYFSDQGAVYAFLNNGAALNPTDVRATMYTVAAQGGKYIALGANGTMYVSDYSGAVGKDSMWLTTLGAVSVLGSINDGSSATVPDTANCIGSGGVWAACSSTVTTSVNAMYTVLNDGGCTPTPETVTFAAKDSQFTAALTQSGTPPAATCNGTFTNGSSFPTTLTFSPSTGSSGIVSETLTATDSLNNTGTATVSGTALALLPQTITAFAGITSPVIYGSGPYTLSATGGASGEPVVFSVDTSSTSGVAAVSGTNGTTLTITGVGTLVIDINQAGNSTYQAAPQVQETITVNQAPQTIVFGAPLAGTTAASPYQAAYGAAPITLTATDSNLSGGGSGNSITFTLDSATTAGAATLANGVLTITGLGTIVVDANQAASADYSAATQVQAFISVVQGSQTITLTPSATTAVYPATISFTATGGASGNKVTLSILSGGTIATLSGNTLTPTGAAFGSVEVAANQLGNTDYGAAPQVTSTVTFTAIGTVATPTFSPASGSTLVVGTSNTVTISDTTANATIYYTTDGTMPTTASTVYTAPFTLTTTGSVTVNALAVENGYNASSVGTATYTVTTVPPNFTATATPTGAVLGPGQSQTFYISMSPSGGFNGTVSFSCSGGPSGVTCAFNPAKVTSDGTDPFYTTLTVTNGSTSSDLRHDSIPFIPGGATFAVALCFLGWKKRRNLVFGLVLMAGIFGLTQLSGCGSGSGPKSTTSTMTVTATSTVGTTTITQTIPLTITIQQ